jgi:hypothetical protein
MSLIMLGYASLTATYVIITRGILLRRAPTATLCAPIEILTNRLTQRRGGAEKDKHDVR